MLRSLILIPCLTAAAALPAQVSPRPAKEAPRAATVPEGQDTELKFAIYLSRHGVRSPTGKSEQYDQYSSAPWPVWAVPPGYLTPHGYRLMQSFGAYDRFLLSSRGLLRASGCDDAKRVTFYADSDQRTQQTGKAIAAGLFPECGVPVRSLPEGIGDPLFHPAPASLSSADAALARAAIAGRIGDTPQAVTDAYHTPLAALDKLLATCGGSARPGPARTSLFDIPAALVDGKGDHAANLHGPLSTASTLTENLLLEYTEGLPNDQVGWGCVDGASLRSLMDLHTAASDINQRTPVIARMQASNLLSTIANTMEQAATQQRVPGALGDPAGRALFLIGHDTNLSNLAGLLNLSWVLDGRRDDTPPGSALVFELLRSPVTREYSVRLFFTAQTLEQMRNETTLSDTTPPPRVPLFLPGCSGRDFACGLQPFLKLLSQQTDARFVSAPTGRNAVQGN